MFYLTGGNRQENYPPPNKKSVDVSLETLNLVHSNVKSSCGTQNRWSLLLVANDFDHYANKRSLFRPQDAVACVAPFERRYTLYSTEQQGVSELPKGDMSAAQTRYIYFTNAIYLKMRYAA